MFTLLFSRYYQELTKRKLELIGKLKSSQKSCFSTNTHLSRFSSQYLQRFIKIVYRHHNWADLFFLFVIALFCKCVLLFCFMTSLSNYAEHVCHSGLFKLNGCNEVTYWEHFTATMRILVKRLSSNLFIIN